MNREETIEMFPKNEETAEFRLVASCIGEDSSKTELNYIYSDGENIIGSDSQVMIVYSKKVPEGFYDKSNQKLSKLECRNEKTKLEMPVSKAKYPPYKNVMLCSNSDGNDSLNLDELEIVYRDSGEYVIIETGGAYKYFEYEHIQKLKAYQKEWTYDKHEKGCVLKLMHKQIAAMLMPKIFQ